MTVVTGVFALIPMRRSWAGSAIGGIDEAYDRVVAGGVRYRFVIDASTFA